MARDFFTQFREFNFRGIGVPITSTRLILRQDLAPHRYVGRPGADVEATGRAPFEIVASIPFFNDIDPGPQETWTRGRLYPTQWKRFLAAMADTSTGDLQHIELGKIKVKPHSFETDWDHKQRGGVPTTASWLETTEDPNALSALIAAVSPLAGAIQAAADIDRHLATVTPPLPSTPTYAPSLADAMRAIQGVFDQTTLLSRRVAGAINGIIYRVNAISDAMTAAGKAPGEATNSVKNWPMFEAIERMKSSLNDLKKNLLNSARPIGLYIPASPATMGKLSVDIPAPITDLMQLNPSLVAKPVVPANTRVRYYLAA